MADVTNVRGGALGDAVASTGGLALGGCALGLRDGVLAGLAATLDVGDVEGAASQDGVADGA
jgi:hypothetical protein